MRSQAPSATTHISSHPAISHHPLASRARAARTWDDRTAIVRDAETIAQRAKQPPAGTGSSAEAAGICLPRRYRPSSNRAREEQGAWKDSTDFSLSGHGPAGELLRILWWSQFICQCDRTAIAVPIPKRIRLRGGSFLSQPPAGMVDLEQGRAVASGLSANPWMIGEPDRESTDGETTDRIEAGIGTGCRLDARPPIRCRRVRRPAAGSSAIRFCRQSALHHRHKPFRHRTRRRSRPAARLLHSRMLHVVAAAGRAFWERNARCATAFFADGLGLALRVFGPQEQAQSR